MAETVNIGLLQGCVMLSESVTSIVKLVYKYIYTATKLVDWVILFHLTSPCNGLFDFVFSR